MHYMYKCTCIIYMYLFLNVYKSQLVQQVAQKKGGKKYEKFNFKYRPEIGFSCALFYTQAQNFMHQLPPPPKKKKKNKNKVK